MLQAWERQLLQLFQVLDLQAFAYFVTPVVVRWDLDLDSDPGRLVVVVH